MLQSILDWVDPTGPSRPVSGSVPHLRWEQVGLFLALAFGLTWLLDLLLWLAGGLRVPAATLVLQAQMLLPAFSAILLGLFFFANSPLHVRTNRSPARLFLYYYLFLTVVYVAFALASVAAPQLLTMTGAISLLLSVLGLLLAIVLRFVSGRPAYARLGLAGAPLKYWVRFGAGLVLFYALQTALNYVFGLGEFVHLRAILPQQPSPALSPLALRAVLAVFILRDPLWRE